MRRSDEGWPYPAAEDHPSWPGGGQRPDWSSPRREDQSGWPPEGDFPSWPAGGDAAPNWTSRHPVPRAGARSPTYAEAVDGGDGAVLLAQDPPIGQRQVPGDPVRLAERILSDADLEAAAIKQQAQGHAAAIRQAAEREASQVHHAEREAEQIRRQAAYQASQIRDAAAREADELRAGAIRLSAELGHVAEYVTRTLALPVIAPAALPRPRAPQGYSEPTRPAGDPQVLLRRQAVPQGYAGPPARPQPPRRQAADDGFPIDNPATSGLTTAPAFRPVLPGPGPARPRVMQPGRGTRPTGPRTAPGSQPHWPGTRTAAPGTAPRARPGGPARQTAAPPREAQPPGRQRRAFRVVTVGTAALVSAALVGAAAYTGIHGVRFFVFRESGQGETPGNFTDLNFLARQAAAQHHDPAPTGRHAKATGSQ
jgi:hypothetical protein